MRHTTCFEALGISFCQTSQLRTRVRKSGSDEDAAEAVEAIEERSVRRMPVSSRQPCYESSVDCDIPVFCTKITSVIGRNAIDVDYDSEDDET